MTKTRPRWRKRATPTPALLEKLACGETIGEHLDNLCCRKAYYCPTENDMECGVHGGFDVCCSHPELHRKRP